jgi:hypothetical protein
MGIELELDCLGIDLNKKKNKFELKIKFIKKIKFEIKKFVFLFLKNLLFITFLKEGNL